MKKFENLLFYYSILVITVFFISFGIMSPKPLNFISAVAMFPIVFYFWVRLTSPQAVGAERWSLRFIFVLLIMSSLGIYGFYFARLIETDPNETALKNQLLETQKKNEELVKKLASPSPQPSVAPRQEDESVSDLIFDTPNPSP